MKKIIGKNGEIREMSLEEAFKENQGLLWSLARKKAHNDPQILYDLFQEGCIGFIKAYRRYDASKGYNFSTYAVPKILGEIIRCLKDTNPQTGQLIRQPRDKTKRHNYKLISIDEQVKGTAKGDDKNSERVELLDIGIDIEDEIIANLDMDRFIEKADNPRHRLILTICRDNDGMPQEEVAKMVGTSQAYVSRTLLKHFKRYKKLEAIK